MKSMLTATIMVKSHFGSRIRERWKMILCTIVGEYRLL